MWNQIEEAGARWSGRAPWWAPWLLGALGAVLVATCWEPGVVTVLPALAAAAAGVVGGVLGAREQAESAARQRQLELQAEQKRREAEANQAARGAMIERRLEERRRYLPQLRTALADHVSALREIRALLSGEAEGPQRGSLDVAVANARDRHASAMRKTFACAAHCVDPELIGDLEQLIGYLEEWKRPLPDEELKGAIVLAAHYQQKVNSRIEQLLVGEDLIE